MPESLRFDHYEVLTRDDGSLFELGRGAMGITYKAMDVNLRTPVALKVINATYLHSEIARQRFIREARSAARLRNPHVAAVYHLGTEGDHYYYAMEFIDGETVDALIKQQGPITPALALQITDQVARALAAAEPHRLVHRDIKPANLMLVREGEEVLVKVIDFGLAKATVPGEGEESATLSLGGFVGTPHFASPEQLEEGDVDVRSDIYSLGVTLWYMLAGQTPFAGSMAQVMSQHLSAAPPFEKLHVPPPLTTLLRSILEKKPERRPQTPADLRRDIERTLSELGADADVPVAVDGTSDEQVLHATRLDSAALSGKEATFEVGATLAARYRLLEDLGDSNVGEIFRARDLSHSRDVRITVLRRHLTEDPTALGLLEQQVEKAAATHHPHLLRVDGIEAVEGASFLVQEWTDGFTLLELLRSRRELETAEALTLAGQAAEGIDHAITHHLTHLEIELHQVFVRIAEPATDRETLLHAPLAEWPEFSVKVNPLGISRELGASDTLTGQTIVGGFPTLDRGEALPGPRCVRALAAVTYELLGGNLSPLGLSDGQIRYSPLAALSEAGNDVLRQALDREPPFRTTREFHRALLSPENADLRRHETRTATVVKSAPAAPVSPAKIAAPASPRGKIPTAFVGGLITVSVIAAIVYFLAHETPKQTASGPAAPAGIEDNPAATSPPATPDGEWVEMIPEDSPPEAPDSLNRAIDDAKGLERARDWPAAVAAWVAIARNFPESEAGRANLEAVIGSLRERPNGMSADEFKALEFSLVDAAELDVLAAMMALGDQWRTPRPADSFAWYCAAAAKGDPEGMLQVGLMLSNGIEGAPDIKKALFYFQEAAEKDHPPAKTALGDCYLNGKGVPADPQRGVALLKEAVAGGERRAMDLLATCYDQGIGVKKDSDEAARLYTEAAKLGYLPALGNLGVLYIKGAGVEQSFSKAVELFRDGSQKGDGYCMALLAQCFESGMGMSKNLPEAEAWYQRAGKAGNARAIQWCKEHHIPIP
ncbi:MAG: protein kinase [Chthoniobacteraceae bacterium]